MLWWASRKLRGKRTSVLPWWAVSVRNAHRRDRRKYRQAQRRRQR